MTRRRILNRDSSAASGSRRVEVAGQGKQPGIVPQVIRDCISWRPRALRRPAVSPDFRKMTRFQRLGETFRYQAARTEYAISPSGPMRSWFILWMRLAFALTIPAIVLLPLAVIMPQLITSASFFLELAVMLASLGLTIAAICFGLKLVMFLWEKFSNVIDENRD